jgi:hypothetical protein
LLIKAQSPLHSSHFELLQKLCSSSSPARRRSPALTR